MSAPLRHRPREGGFVAVWLAIMATILIVTVGFAVDLGNWKLTGGRAQGAAEAAALAGVTFLPDDPATAEAIARQVALDHGYDPADPDITVSVSLGAGPTQLEVEISQRVDNLFTAVVGINSTTVTRSAVAEFAPPVEIGSPDPIMGNDPESGHQPDFWLSQAGQQVEKDQGDRYSTFWCAVATTYECSGWSGNNEFNGGSYNYVARVSDATQPLRIQLFDPIWAWVGSDCSFPFWPTAAEIADLQADALTNPDIPDTYYDDAAVRYAGGNDEWCTGDDYPNLGAPGMNMSVGVYAPDDTPWTDNDNPFVGYGCWVTFNGTEVMSPYTLPIPSVYELLSSRVGGDTEWQVRADGVPTFAETFRRWYTVCDLPAAATVEGDYIIKVFTDSSGGQNRFSLRSGPPQGAGISDVGQSAFAREGFPIYANADGANTEFFLARVPPGVTDRILRLTFFDIGDASNPGKVQVLPPDDANVVHFDDCTFTRSDGVAVVPGINCQINNVSRASGYNGTLVEVEVLIPASYDCDHLDPDGCWVKVVADFGGGVTDFTTWTAEIDGDSVRLVG
ncbi:MAG: hypothetical protein KDB21_02810 [Acidimicrobiales bacterium]|nr:hypothetical protein [Acidimicrobiales bacterium]